MKATPKYQKIKESILEKIQGGKLQTDEQLPSVEYYMEKFDVSAITVRRALSELAEEGYIRRIKRKGTFVNDPGSFEASSHLIAVILSTEDYYDTSYMEIIKGAQSFISEYDYSLLIEWTDLDNEQERASVQRMLDKKVDGFIIYPFDPVKSENIFCLIEKENIPYVLVDRYNLHHPCYFSGSDNYSGAILATSKLIEFKHTKIKFAAYHFFLPSEQERYDGFCSAMRAHNLDVSADNLLIDIDYDDLKQKIISHEVTALFCVNDRLALKIMSRLTELGVRIPEDVSIIGFDDWDNARNKTSGLSTVRQYFNEIGSNAAYLLISAIQGQLQGRNVKMLAGVTLVERDSVIENPYA
ncbi:substrate-binding domain-containing protein [Eubacteriales bacterium mix99]|jgi:DNA-binding LacI/PurR family transcriptional regulator